MAGKQDLPAPSKPVPMDVVSGHALWLRDQLDKVNEHYTPEAATASRESGAASPSMYKLWDDSANLIARKIAKGVASEEDYAKLRTAETQMEKILRANRDYMALQNVMKPGTSTETWDSRHEKDFRSRYPSIPVNGLSAQDIEAGKGIGNTPKLPPPPPESLMSRLLVQPPRPQAPKSRTK